MKKIDKRLAEYWEEQKEKDVFALAEKLKEENAKLMENVLKKFEDHIKDNDDRFAKLDKFMLSLQPMVDIFNDNTTARMVFEKKTKTWYVYSKEALTIGALAAAIWKIITFHQ